MWQLLAAFQLQSSHHSLQLVASKRAKMLQSSSMWTTWWDSPCLQTPSSFFLRSRIPREGSSFEDGGRKFNSSAITRSFSTEQLAHIVTLSPQATPFFCNRSSSREVTASIDLCITSTLNLQLMSKSTALGVTQGVREVQRTGVEREEQKLKICWRELAEISTRSK